MDVEKELEALEPLDLRRCLTVGDIVHGFSKCSFGARMVGEMALTLAHLIAAGEHPVIVYDGKSESAIGNLLRLFVTRGWFGGIISPREVGLCAGRAPLFVVGPFSERYHDTIYGSSRRLLFVNKEELSRPGQVRDGYFPDVVFADPNFILPLIDLSLSEYLGGRRYGVEDLLKNFKFFGGVAPEVAHGAWVLKKMVEDKACRVFMTVSGAMTVAQMGLVLCDMIDLGFIQSLTTTGALMAHGLVMSIGLKHYKYNPAHTDALLLEHKLNRVTDTLEPETNFDHIESVVNKVFLEFDGRLCITPRLLNERIGRYLTKHYPNERGILKSAYKKDVPIFVPGFIDSEIGNDLFVHNQRRPHQRRLVMDLERDTEYRLKMKINAEKIGIFTIGGGVPRNNDQNDSPLIDIINNRLDKDLPRRKYLFGCRIAPDAMHFGNLGGCSYPEGGSWGKMNLEEGIFAEIRLDATPVWPLYVKFLMDRLA